MVTPLGPGPLVYGHRGASAYAGDNTLESIELAYDQGADGVEIDVRTTADGTLILSHDPADAAVGVLARATFDEIRRRAPHIPTLAEALATVPADRFVNVEIKNELGEPDFDPARRLVAPTLAQISVAGMLDRVLVSSFDPITMGLVRRSAPGVAAAQLLTPFVEPLSVIGWVHRTGLDAIAVPVPSLAGDRLETVVEAAGAYGLGVSVWTVDDPDEIRRLADGGVDVIITNDPKTAVEALEDRR